MFKKNWYSLYRWKNPFTYPSDGMIGRVIDAGVFTSTTPLLLRHPQGDKIYIRGNGGSALPTTTITSFVTNNYSYGVSINGVISANSFIGNKATLSSIYIQSPITQKTNQWNNLGINYTLNTNGEAILFLAASANILLPPASASTIGSINKIYYTKGVVSGVIANGSDVINNLNTYVIPSTTADWACVEIIGYTSTSWIAVSSGPP